MNRTGFSEALRVYSFERGVFDHIAVQSLLVAEEPSPTFASQIWPALGIPFVGGWPTMRGPTETATLLSLGRMCSIEGPDAVQTIPSQDGPPKYSVQYARWS
jgi:hypothetical protein